MPITKEEKQKVIQEFARFPGDTGSTEVQVSSSLPPMRTLLLRAIGIQGQRMLS